MAEHFENAEMLVPSEYSTTPYFCFSVFVKVDLLHSFEVSFQ